MSPEDPEFYDNDEVFKTYVQSHRRKDNPNDTLEKPVLWELMGQVECLKILDSSYSSSQKNHDYSRTIHPHFPLPDLPGEG